MQLLYNYIINCLDYKLCIDIGKCPSKLYTILAMLKEFGPCPYKNLL